MEGHSPYSFCTLTSCKTRKKTWVPAPPRIFPKRFALADAYTLTEDPCHPPGRCFPCSKPVPKFRLIRKFGGCDKTTMDQVKAEKEAAKKEEWQQYHETPQPTLEIGIMDPTNHPVEFQIESGPQGRCNEMKYKTDLTAGFFNSDDNKTYEELQREKCDPSWSTCNPTLPQYPCRGVINYPCLRWVTKDEENRLCFPAHCKTDTCSYLTPEKLFQFQKKKEQWTQQDALKQAWSLEEQNMSLQQQNVFGDCYQLPR